MNRTRLGVLSLVGVTGLAALAAGSGTALPFHRRVQEFQAAQSQRRAALNLPRKELYQRYPTPELRLVRAARAAPGQTVQIKATGRIPQGSLVGFDCDDLQVLSLRQSTTAISATVKIPPTFHGHACRLHAYAPVTSASNRVEALTVAAKYVWTLSLSNGMRVEAEAISERDRSELRTSWKQGAREIGDRKFQVGRPVPGEVRLKVQRTAEDEAMTEAAWQAAPERAERDRLFAELARLRRAADEECRGDPSCQERLGGPIQTLFAAQLPRLQQREREILHVHPTACDELVLAVSERGKVTGTAYGCAGAPTAEIRGQVVIRGLETP